MIDSTGLVRPLTLRPGQQDLYQNTREVNFLCTSSFHSVVVAVNVVHEIRVRVMRDHCRTLFAMDRSYCSDLLLTVDLKAEKAKGSVW